MQGGDEPHPARLDRLLKLGDHIPLRAHLRGVPFRPLGVPHGEAVVVLGHGPGEAGAGLLEELRPLIRIELLRGEHGDVVFVAEPIERAIGLLVVLACLGVRVHVQLVAIPGGIASKGRHGVDTPVGVDSEFPIPKPPRRWVAPQRFPRGFIGRGTRGLVPAATLSRRVISHHSDLLLVDVTIRYLNMSSVDRT